MGKAQYSTPLLRHASWFDNSGSMNMFGWSGCERHMQTLVWAVAQEKEEEEEDEEKKKKKENE